MRREFKLPDEDEEYLNALGLPWETVSLAGVSWLLVGEYLVPAGYNHQKVSLAIRIEAAYPPGKLDMAYFFPALARTDGKPVGGLTPLELDGKTYQQWSRHYDWLPEEHTLITHLGCVEHWLTVEFQKR